MTDEAHNNVHLFGRTMCVCTMTLLIVGTVSPPEDFQTSLHGTESILAPSILRSIKFASRLLAYGLLSCYLIRMLWSRRLFQSLGTMFPLIVFCGWIFGSTIWSPLKSTTFNQSATFSLLLVLSLAIGLSCQGIQDVKRILRHVSVILLLVAAFLIGLRLGAPQFGALTKASSGLFHSTAAGATSSLALMILLLSWLLWGWKWSSRLLLPGLIVHGTVMLIGGNRLSLALAVVLGILSVAWLLPDYRVAAVSLVVGLIATVYLVADPRLEVIRASFAEVGTFLSQGQSARQLHDVSGRAEMWNEMWKSYLDSPIIGHGYFVTSAAGELYVWYEWGNWTAHNIFLQLLTTSGIVGATFLFSGFFLLALPVMGGRKRDNKMSKFLLVLSVWFLCWGMLNSSFLGPLQPESVIFATAVGFALVMSRENREYLRSQKTLAVT